jgi:hypothetical protein
MCKHICNPHKPKHRPKLAKELPHLRAKENFKIFFTTLQKNKTPGAQARQKSTRQMTATDDIKMVVTHYRQKRQPITAPTINWRDSASYESLFYI